MSLRTASPTPASQADTSPAARKGRWEFPPSRRAIFSWCVAVALAALAATASASLPGTFEIEQIYSNAAGTVQFVVIHDRGRSDCDSDENLWAGQTLKSSGGSGANQTFVFPANLPTCATSGKRILIATQAFAALGIVSPDYVILNGFVQIPNGALDFAGVSYVRYTSLPNDGVTAILTSGAIITHIRNLATNLAGQSASIGSDNAPSTHSLTVSRTGSGTVTSSPSGINCGNTCQASFADGTQVALTATAASGYQFNGWGGACSGTSASCTVTMNQVRAVSASFVVVNAGPPSASVRFDSAIGPTTKTIVRNSGTEVKFAWKTTNLPSGTTCKILLRPNDSYNAAASPVSGGTRTDANIQGWSAGQKMFYLRCSNGTISPDITLTITGPAPTATLRFDSATGPTTKTIVRNSGAPVKFAWTTQNLPSGTACKILLRPNDAYNAAASPVAAGTRTDTNIQGWSAGQKVFYLRCSNGTTSPNITLTITGPAPTATLRFDSATGPTTKTIVQNSGTSVTFAWKTTNLPSGTTCKILLRPNDSYNAAASPVSGGTRIDGNIHAWSAGAKQFYLRCSNGTTSPDITLTITGPAPTATLRFDSATGPMTKTIVQNSGTSVTFAWKTTNLPSGTTCKILLRPNDSYNAAASPASGGTRIDGNIHAWSAGAKQFYLRCSNGTTSPDITLMINSSRYVLSVQKTGNGGGTVTSNPTGINCGSTCSASFAANSTVTLTANASGGSSAFTGWTGACSGSAATCVVTMTAARTVGAMFSSGSSATQTLAAGGFHGCAIVTGGAVECWGDNAAGQLGNGTTTNSATAVTVTVTGVGGATAVAAGDGHSCAIIAGGAVKCWGDNLFGQLGNGTTTSSLTAVTVTGVSGATAVAAGQFHTCVIVAGGAVKCWGDNGYGQLGNGTTTMSTTAVDVTGVNGAMAVTAGQYHTCVVVVGGAVKCWGGNRYGQLGNGATTNSPGSTAVDVIGIDGAMAVAAGNAHTCAIVTDGAVRCWGYNAEGQLGNGTTTDSPTAVNVTGIGGATVMAAGWAHTCATVSGGAVKCWGSNQYGQLGNGTTVGNSTAASVTGVGGATEMAANGYHTCATVAGAARCWGSNRYGQLGNGTTTDSSTAVPVIGVTTIGVKGTIAMVANGSHACALASRAAACRENTGFGQPGNGSTNAYSYDDGAMPVNDFPATIQPIGGFETTGQ